MEGVLAGAFKQLRAGQSLVGGVACEKRAPKTLNPTTRKADFSLVVVMTRSTGRNTTSTRVSNALTGVCSVAFLCLALFCATTDVAAQSEGEEFHGSGKIQSIIIENFAPSSEMKNYSLALDNGLHIPLSISDLPADVLLNSLVQVDGVWESRVGVGLSVVPSQILPLFQFAASALPTTASGARKALVLKVGFNGASVACSNTQLANTMWTGTRSVREFYETATYNQMTWTPDVDGDASQDVFAVSINYSVSPCAYATWVNAAMTQATGMGVNLALYQHVIVMVPTSVQSSCGFAGIAPLNCGSSCWMISADCSYPDIVIHELGHNLGLNHAGTDFNDDGEVGSTATDEYGDWSCPMGISGVGYRRFNAPHQRQMGWMPDDREQSVTTSGTYTIASSDIDPLTASPTPPTQTQVLTIPINGSSQSYYLSFRRSDSGYSQELQSAYSGRTNIHRFSGSGRTMLVDVIANGEVSTLSNGISVSQLSSGTGWAQVQVSIGTPIATATPTPETSPGSDPTPVPTATPTPAPGTYHVTGQVVVKSGQEALFSKLRVVIEGPKAGQRRRKALEPNGTFAIDLKKGAYRFRLERKPGSSSVKSLNVVAKTLTVPSKLSISIRARR